MFTLLVMATLIMRSNIQGLPISSYVFTENVERENILSKGDHITPSLDEVLYLNKLNTAISYPKNRINVLLA